MRSPRAGVATRSMVLTTRAEKLSAVGILFVDGG
jgi:hypothetical protein